MIEANASWTIKVGKNPDFFFLQARNPLRDCSRPPWGAAPSSLRTSAVEGVRDKVKRRSVSKFRYSDTLYR